MLYQRLSASIQSPLWVGSKIADVRQASHAMNMPKHGQHASDGGTIDGAGPAQTTSPAGSGAQEGAVEVGPQLHLKSDDSVTLHSNVQLNLTFDHHILACTRCTEENHEEPHKIHKD